ncbi:MAG: hypothetical protein Fur005_38910 [Roseiflexaceae bacterium]
MNTANITTTELLAILDVTRRLAEQRMVQPLIEYVGTTVFELIPAETCLILLFDKDDEILTPFARNRNGNQVPNPLKQVSHSILERVRATLSPLVVSDAQNQENFRSSQSIRILGLRSVMCVPLVSYGQAVGAIYLENRSARGRFREESLLRSATQCLANADALLAAASAKRACSPWCSSPIKWW